MSSQEQKLHLLRHLHSKTGGEHDDLIKEAVLLGSRPYPHEPVEAYLKKVRHFMEHRPPKNYHNPGYLFGRKLAQVTDNFQEAGIFSEMGDDAGRFIELIERKYYLSQKELIHWSMFPAEIEKIFGYGLADDYGLDFCTYQLDIGVSVDYRNLRNSGLVVAYRTVPKIIVPAYMLAD